MSVKFTTVGKYINETYKNAKSEHAKAVLFEKKTYPTLDRRTAQRMMEDDGHILIGAVIFRPIYVIDALADVEENKELALVAYSSIARRAEKIKRKNKLKALAKEKRDAIKYAKK